MEKEPTLRFNPETGLYEGTLLVQVDPEIFRRFLIHTVEEDQAADLTDPQTWTRAIAKAGKITNWLGRPHVTISPVAASPTMVEQQPSEVRPMTKAKLMENRLREKARQVAPYKWDMECLTPTPPGDASLSREARAEVGRVRYEERQVLKLLRAEWEAGSFHLEAGAAEAQAAHEQQEQGKVTTKLETVATALNGIRLR